MRILRSGGCFVVFILNFSLCRKGEDDGSVLFVLGLVMVGA